MANRANPEIPRGSEAPGAVLGVQDEPQKCGPSREEENSNEGGSGQQCWEPLSRAGLLTKQGFLLRAAFGSLSLMLLPKPGLAP